MKATAIISDDDDENDDGRSSFHRPVKGNSITKSDDDDQRFSQACEWDFDYKL